jgi:hypothetical protein
LALPPDGNTPRDYLAIYDFLMRKNKYGEQKKARHILLTDTAYRHVGDIAHEARLSTSETLERLIRSTPIWEGSATLANGAFDLIEDYSISPSELPQLDESL